MKKTLLVVTALLLPSASAVSVNVKNASDPVAFVNQPIVKARLQKLMGLIQSRFLYKNFSTVSSLQTGKMVVVTGCRKDDCAANGSLVAYDPKADAFKVWLVVDGKSRTFHDKAWKNDAALNSDAKAYIKDGF